MVETRRPDRAEITYWEQRDGRPQNPVLITDQPEENTTPCPALLSIDDGQAVGHVAYDLSPDELAELVRGGRLWLTTWGGVPIHRVEVIGRDAVPGTWSSSSRPTREQAVRAVEDLRESMRRMYPNGAVGGGTLGVALSGPVVEVMAEHGIDVADHLADTARGLGFDGVRLENERGEEIPAPGAGIDFLGCVDDGEVIPAPAPTPQPVRCPVCGERPELVDMIDTGQGGAFRHEVPGTYHCPNEDDDDHRLWWENHRDDGRRVVRDRPQA